ncbi:uncharacterized protein LOC109821934, partial [Asparagus officinalis]|uniref:uncharacterized protein LOC109821934 n=1 Tax=Asparagus officinalis TaxID=4686 RepID=UPI00098E07CB
TPPSIKKNLPRTLTLNKHNVLKRRLRRLLRRRRRYLRPPYLDTNSFLSQNLDDFLLHSDSGSDSDADDQISGDLESKHRRLVAKEESKLEKEIIKIINSGGGVETLKPNSGQSVSIGDHNICVGVHDEKGSEYRVWEWHGHIMLFDEEDGYSAEYIYGNYFERVVEKKEKKGRDEEEEEEDGSKVKGEGNSGLRDLIGSETEKGARVVHRNSLNAGLSAAK